MIVRIIMYIPVHVWGSWHLGYESATISEIFPRRVERLQSQLLGYEAGVTRDTEAYIATRFYLQ